MTFKKRQTWRDGDYFVVPLANGTYSIAQVIRRVPEAMNSVLCAFWGSSTASVPIEMPLDATDDSLVAVLLVTRDLLDSGDWRIFQHGHVFQTQKYFDFDEWKRKRFVGARIIGSGIVIKLMNAFFGLAPWNAFHEPNYLDKLLISPSRKPAQII